MDVLFGEDQAVVAAEEQQPHCCTASAVGESEWFFLQLGGLLEVRTRPASHTVPPPSDISSEQLQNDMATKHEITHFQGI